MNPSVDQKRHWDLMNDANRLIVELSKRPTWTIAMGAMLASGLRPVPGCKEVPDEAVWLLDASQPANARQLRQARRVVDEWTEDRQDEDGWGVPAEECSPLEFLTWCDETYQGSPGSMKPEWLDYLVSLTEVPSPSAPQLGSSIEMTERLLLLEHFAIVKGQSGADGVLSPAHTPDGYYVARTKELIVHKKITAVYALAVATAQDRAMNPFDAVEILDALRDMAMAPDKRWKHALQLKPSTSTDSLVLYVPRGVGWIEFDKTGLQQYLNRISRKLPKPR